MVHLRMVILCKGNFSYIFLDRETRYIGDDGFSEEGFQPRQLLADHGVDASQPAQNHLADGAALGDLGDKQAEGEGVNGPPEPTHL